MKEKKHETEGLIHDLRNPLAVISYSSDLLENILQKPGTSAKIPKGDKIRCEQLFKNIRFGIRELNNIINNLLEPDKLNLGRHDLKAMLSNLVETFQNSFCEGVRTFELHYAIRETQFIFDFDKIERAMENLLLNSVKFTHKGMIIVQVNENEEMVLISVKDSGRGMPKEHLDRIFEYGFSGGAEAGYHGIGLYNVKKIFEQHKGSVEAFSTEGVGSVFRVFLPKIEMKI